MKIVKENVSNEIIIEKSKFITHLCRCNSIIDANNIYSSFKKKFFDASHNCMAYIISDFAKSTDDGEPSGTAGIQILEVLKKNEITNTICIVTRYFGGIKLGKGGLIRAYTNSTIEALNKATFIQNIVIDKYSFSINYNVYNAISDLICEYGYILNVSYEDNIKIIFGIQTANLNILIDKISNIILSTPKLIYVGKSTIDIPF